jgi:predicted protein tyrosine phosphatase
MKVYVSSRSQVAKVTSKTGATHVLSLLDPGKRPFLHPKTPLQNWRLWLFEDVIDPSYDRAPKKEQVAEILEWAATLPNDAVLLVHCEAGISRSTAMALAILVQHHGLDQINRCVDLLFGVRPEAAPNPLIAKYADDILKCGGQLEKAAEKLNSNKLLRRF